MKDFEKDIFTLVTTRRNSNFREALQRTHLEDSYDEHGDNQDRIKNEIMEKFGGGEELNDLLEALIEQVCFQGTLAGDIAYLQGLKDGIKIAPFMSD